MSTPMHRFHVPTHELLDALAHDIAERGIDHPLLGERLGAVLLAGRGLVDGEVVTAIVGDPSAPAVARERAFGRLAELLTRPRSAQRRPIAA